VELSEDRVVRALGTVAAIAGFAWLVLLQDSGYDEWRFLAAVLTLSGLLLRIESAVVRNGIGRPGPRG
jgi:hypothetical protein